jgi:ATP-binding cassette, subfamily B, bacterial MsbA
MLNSPTYSKSHPAMQISSTSNVFLRFAAYYKPHLKILLIGYALLILASASEPLIPAMLKRLLDHISQHSGALNTPSRWAWWQAPAVVIALFAGRALILFAASIALASVNTKAGIRLQEVIFHHLLACKLSIFEQESTSSLINTMRFEVTQAGSAFIHIIQEGGKNFITALALLGYLFWLNWNLTLVVLVVLPFVAWTIKRIGQRIRKIHQGLVASSEELNYIIEENTHAHRIVRLFGAQAQQITRFSERIGRYRSQMTRGIVAAAAMTPVTQIAAACAFAVILALALQQSDNGHGSVGDFAAYLTTMLMLISPIKSLADVVPSFHRGKVSIERIFDILDYPVEPAGGSYNSTELIGDIVLTNICKSYPASNRPALNCVSLTLKRGKMLALVGASGSGKSTLANLLPQFIPLDKGEILINNVNTVDWNLVALRRMIAMVTQDTVLLNDTILANIALGDVNPDIIRAQQALESAHLVEHVRSLPQGIHTRIGHNGNTLSGGQRQRLAIARAFYHRAPLLILDEATSALDSESERLVQDAITHLTQGCTTLVIAHRLSTIRNANWIVVMDKGRIAEQGTYNDLITKNGIFTKLVQQQFSA